MKFQKGNTFGRGRPRIYPAVTFASYKATINTSKHARRALSLCLSCPAKTDGKHAHCENCRQKRSKKAKRKQNQLKRLNLCISGDGHKAAKDRVYCENCLEKKRRRAASK